MSKGLSQWIRNSILTRDNFTCQKCKHENKTGNKLEVHHIKPRYLHGSDDASNLITLCLICHKYAPNSEEEFKEYLGLECDGQLTVLLRILKEARKSGKFPEIFKDTI